MGRAKLSQGNFHIYIERAGLDWSLKFTKTMSKHLAKSDKGPLSDCFTVVMS